MLEVENISKTFGSYKALDQVSLHVQAGRVMGLLGPNGAGKTTLIRIINRLSLPDSGTILFNGHPIAPSDSDLIGYLPEERGLYKKMRVGEQALYLAQLKGLPRNVAEERLHQWFARFDIDSWWNRRVDELSKGMQQKVQFIVTILHNPPLLIFDEPFSGFDPLNASILKNEILHLRDEGTTIILSTHNMASVEELCSHIALIHRSHLLLNGPLNDIKTQHNNLSLNDIFLQVVSQ